MEIRKNGKLYKDRICPECGRKHFHGENMCIGCRNARQKKNSKKKYQKIRSSPWQRQKEKRLARHAERIRLDIRQITEAGLTAESTMQEITDAGVKLGHQIQ